MYLRSLLFTCLYLVIFASASRAQGEACNNALPIVLPMGVNEIALNADGPSTGNSPSDFATGIFPGITHSDWYAFTAPEDGVISLSSCGGGADSYLFLHRGPCNSLINIDFNDDACDLDDEPGTPNNFASLLENIPVQAGTTYYIEWTNAWEEGPFGWTFSFQPVAGDVAMESGLNFTHLSDEQAQGGIPVEARIVSKGPADAENVRIEARIRNAQGVIVDEGTLQLAALLAGTSQESTLFTWTPPGLGAYTVSYRVSADNNDLFNNDTLVQQIQITDAVFALDNDQRVGTIGGVPEDTVSQGQVFTYLQSDQIQSVSAFLLGGQAGEEVQAEVFAFSNGEPGNRLATSQPITLDGPDPGWLHFRFDASGNGFPVSAGDPVLVVVTYFSQGGQLGLGYADEVYRNGRTWIRGKTTADEWVSLESQGQNLTYLLRTNNGLQQQSIRLQVDLFNQALEDQFEDPVYLAWYTQNTTPLFEPMTDRGDSTFSIELDLLSLDTLYYFFAEGVPAPEGYESVPPACGRPVSFQGSSLNVRYRVIPFENEEAPLVCFSGCEDCASVPCQDPAALLCERFETYETGPISPQSSNWSVQAGGADAPVSDERASSGTKALKMDAAQASGQSLLLNLQNLTADTWELSFAVYIPEGQTAACNVQHQSLPEIFASFLDFGPDGTGRLALSPGEPVATFSHPEDQWFTVRHLIDMANDQARLFVDGEAIFTWRFSRGVPSDLLQLAALNFTLADDQSLYFVDDIFLRAVNTPPANDLCAFATDLTDLFGGPEGVGLVSSLQNNLTATAEGFDPNTGFDCFEDQPALDNSLWFTFTGDGFTYGLETVACAATDYLRDGNTQMAVYTGTCENLQPVACNETRSGFPGETGPAGLDLDTDLGQTYYILIDGFFDEAAQALSQGEFCLKVTRGMLSGLSSGALETAVRLYPNPSTDRSWLDVQLPEPGELYVELVDPVGRILWGRHAQRQDRHRIPIDLAHLPKGMYWVRIQHAEAVLTRPLVHR